MLMGADSLRHDPMAGVLATALRNGRVTAKTAGKRSIARCCKYGLLIASELAGVYVLTDDGRFFARHPVF
jgi:hypothetical protein